MRKFLILWFICLLCVFLSGCLESGGGGGGGLFGGTGFSGDSGDSGGDDGSDIIYIIASDNSYSFSDDASSSSLSSSTSSSEPLGNHTPEPSSLVLLSTGLLAAWGYRRFKKHR